MSSTNSYQIDVDEEPYAQSIQLTSEEGQLIDSPTSSENDADKTSENEVGENIHFHENVATDALINNSIQGSESKTGELGSIGDEQTLNTNIDPIEFENQGTGNDIPDQPSDETSVKLEVDPIESFEEWKRKQIQDRVSYIYV